MGDKISYRLQAPGFWLLPRWLKLAHPLWMETICLAAILVAVGAFYICNINPYALGPLAYDDGIYVVLAKALATGQGYRLISFPGDPPQTLYPPFYPFLLSIVWRLRPDFPENLKPMLMISSIAAVMFLLLTYGYLTRRGYAEPKFALIIVLLTALNPVTLFYATRAMSDMVYAVLAVAGLWLAEEYAEGHRRWRYGVITGVVLGLGFLTRVVNVALIVAAVIYLARKRRFKKLALVSAVALAFVIAWSIWSYVEHIRTDSPLVRSSRNINYLAYMLDQLVLWKFGFLKIILKNVLHLVLTLGSTLIAFFIPIEGSIRPSMNVAIISLTPALVLVVLGLMRSLSSGIKLMYLFSLLYFGAIAVSPWEPEQRYMVPLFPLLLLVSGFELKRLANLLIEELLATEVILNRAIAVLLCAWIALWGAYVTYGYVDSIKIFTGELKAFYDDQWLEQSKVFEYITKNTDGGDVLVCDFDPIWYLYTGRKAVRAYACASVDRLYYKFMPQWEPSETLAIIKESRAKHLIVELAPLFNYWGRRVVESEPEAFTLVFRSPNSYLLVYRVNRERL